MRWLSTLHPASFAALLVQCFVVGCLNFWTVGWPWNVRNFISWQFAGDLLIGLGAVVGGVYLVERFFRTSGLQVSIKGVLIITACVATALTFLQYNRLQPE